MSLEDQQKRYITLSGEKIHTRPLVAMLTSPDLKTPALLAAFNAASLATHHNLTVALAGAGFSLFMSTIGYSMGQAVKHKFLRDAFGEKVHALSIDKAPGKNTPPTSSPNMRGARWNAANGAVFGTGMIAVNVLINPVEFAQTLYGYLSFNVGNAPFAMASVTSTVATLSGLSFIHAYNHYKVMKKDWVITDLPVPEQKKVKATQTALKPI